jgi:mediator of RNA polymerase II transcription subunit 21
MHACLAYINDKAPTSRIDGQPDMTPLPLLRRKDSAPPESQAFTQPSNANANDNNNTQQSGGADPDRKDGGGGGGDPLLYQPDPPEAFQASLRELARDLIMKEQQIEYLIDVLPGIGQSERAQEARMKELEAQLRDVEGERREAVREKEALVQRLDEVIARVRRY